MSSNSEIVSLLKSITSRLDKIEAAVGVSAAAGADEDPVQIRGYDAFRAEAVDPFVATTRSLGNSAEGMASATEDAFNRLRAFLVMASRCKKPDASVLRGSIGPLQDIIRTVSGLRDNRHELGNHFNALNEAIQSLGWVCVEPTPVPFVESFLDGATFWSNKIRVAVRKGDLQAEHGTWCDQLRDMLKALAAYVKDHHTTGVKWNPSGGDVASYSAEDSGSAAAPAPAPKATAAMPPPPPPPPPPAASAAPKPAPSGAAFLAEIKSGKGLRHVSDDQKVYKNTALRASSKVADGPGRAAARAPAAATRAAAAEPAREPSVALQGRRWVVEYQREGEPVVVRVEDSRQQVLVFGCKGATILVEGKCNAISMDQCVKTNLVFDSSIATCEVVNCKSVKLQVKQSAPSVSIDKTDSCLLYLNASAKGAHITTSKCSDCNVSFPEGDTDDSDWATLPLPEQFVHTIEAGRVATKVSELYG